MQERDAGPGALSRFAKWAEAPKPSGNGGASLGDEAMKAIGADHLPGWLQAGIWIGGGSLLATGMMLAYA